MSQELYGRFGLDFRRALFACTSSRGASRLGMVLLDVAYTQKALTFEAGRRFLQRETLLSDVRSFNRVKDELVDAGLVHVEVEGRGRGARTFWTLLLPALPNGRRGATDQEWSPEWSLEWSPHGDHDPGSDPGVLKDQRRQSRARAKDVAVVDADAPPPPDVGELVVGGDLDGEVDEIPDERELEWRRAVARRASA